jgi:hypothetical protein
MTATRSGASRGKRTIAGVVALILALSALSSALATVARTDSRSALFPSADGELLLLPLADLVTASSWLAIVGEDPRHATLPAADDGARERAGLATATPVPGDIGGDFSRERLVSRALGPLGVSASPALAVDPTDPNHVILATTDLDLPSTAVYASVDGGASWDGPRQVPYSPGDRGAVGNASLAFGAEGSLYLATLSLSSGQIPLGNSSVGAPVTHVAVSRSDDGGSTWVEPSSAARAGAQAMTMVDASGRTRGEVRAGFIDSPALAVGSDPASPANDILYLAYTEFSLRYPILYADELPILGPAIIESTIQLARSTDRGESWSAPVAISPVASISPGAGVSITPPSNVDQPSPTGMPPVTPAAAANSAPSGEQVVQGPALAILGDGSLGVAYFDSTADGVQRGLARIMVASSGDGGRSFSEPAQAGVFRELPLSPRTLPVRWWSSGFPRVAVGPHDEIFLVITAQTAALPADDGDLLLLRSLDRGQRWEEPVVIDAGTVSSPQFFPALAATTDGTLHAIWGDTRDDPSGIHYEILYAASTDNGASWAVTDPLQSVAAPDRRISSQASNALFAWAGGRFLGDRFALAPAGDDLAIAWVTVPETGAREAIGFSRKTGGPSEATPAPAAPVAGTPEPGA